ncbi:MAG TPA: MarR family winged helix-turn-helix transcriptional regulator [Alphaproteobacteria bacterium]|nr:MarR family winged helix-turn-helix transcriptional regulator [Alphaproteobacteria bacterium]
MADAPTGGAKSERPATEAAGQNGPGQSGYLLEEQIGHILRRAHQRASAIFSAQFAEFELTPTQFAALAKIGDGGEVSQNRIGRLTAMDPATVQGVIGRLEKRGLIASKPDPDDRRRTLWRLTAKGADLLASAVPSGIRTTEATLAPLGVREQRVLIDLLGRLS